MAAPHSPNKPMKRLDVPQDVDLAAEHWNDPNYDIDSLPSPSIITRDSFELEAKDVGNASAGYSTTDFDGESQTGSVRNFRKSISNHEHEHEEEE
jgi:hypothetical protein